MRTTPQDRAILEACPDGAVAAFFASVRLPPVRTFIAESALTLFVIIDPIGVTPIFIGLCGDRGQSARNRIARRSVVIAGIVLLVFIAAGSPLLQYLGVTVGALKVAGGILLFKVAYDMVLVQRERQSPEEALESAHRQDPSVFPLAIPMMAGPGALASVLVLSTEADGNPRYLAALIAVIVVVLGLAYVFFRFSDRIVSLLGTTGVNVVTRVLGLILAALAVQCVADGISNLGF